MVIASIDLMDGKAVQLRQGREKVLERHNPLLLAREFDRYGEIAVIDLDAAMNRGENLNPIKEILKRTDSRVGGGIRSLESAKKMISLGAKKIIIGSKVFEGDKINHSFLHEIVEAIDRYRVIIAIDALNGEIVTKAWKHRTGLNIFDVIERLEQYASEFLFTCVEKEGTLRGIDMKIVNRLAKSTKNKITVAGGVSSMDEVRELARIGVNMQLGMALYTGKINLAEGFVESLNWKSELIPTITQDYTGQVLTLAYSNKDSLLKTFKTGKMCYFSRSRNKLWTKGETSGNTQEFLRLRADCDRDALLATVRQKGVACHTGEYSCFGSKKFSIYQVYERIKDRMETPRAESRTVRLTDDSLRDKLLKKVREITEAQATGEIINLTADVLYFFMTLAGKNGIDIEDILLELERRENENN